MFRLLYFVSISIFFITCQQQSKPISSPLNYQKLGGITMGVIPYNITYFDQRNKALQPTIDSLLDALNAGSSTYEKMSTISRFNASDSGISIEKKGVDIHFINNILLAKKIVSATDGYFDPTVAPLVNYYGFGNKGKKGVTAIDSIKIKDLMKSVGFDKIQIQQKGNQFLITKKNKDTQLDFSAIAKGYAIDIVGKFLEGKNIQDYFIDIGGEIRAHGKSPRGDNWKTGIRDPLAPVGYRLDSVIVSLENRAMATSGNYENFRIVQGKKIGHTMNPKSGFPEINNILSATVIAKECSVADSYATAFMAMGMEKAFNLAQNLPEIQAYLVYFDKNGIAVTKYTAGLEKFLIK